VFIIEEQAKTRLPFLVPIRHSRMLASPFAFLRGSAAVMAADLAQTPTTGITVQACGDMHVANFGVFASAERTLVFGINDFDETLPGPWEWDLKRLAASAVVCGRFLGAQRVLCEESARAVVKSYRKRMREYAEMSYLDVWYARISERDVLNAYSATIGKRVKQVLAKAKKRGHLQVLDKMAELVGNQQRIIEVRPFIVRETHTEFGRPIAEALGMFLENYFQSLADDRKVILARYRIIDVARKVVGVGSVGTRCWVILMQGNESDDPLFLQVKQAEASVLAPYASASGSYPNNGQRVVAGQRIIQGAPDIFLGWAEGDGRQFYVRQLRDMKGGANMDRETVVSVETLPDYSALCGWALALAPAKSGDPAMLAGYLGKSGV
jgi:uncharacterized protein (DUF2252 family)